MNDLLRRWNTLDAAARGRLARKVLARVAGAGTDWSTATDSALREQLEQLARGSRA